MGARTSLRALTLTRYNAACQFLERNNLLSIIRAHEAQDAGCVCANQLSHVPEDQGDWLPISDDDLFRAELSRCVQQQGGRV